MMTHVDMDNEMGNSIALFDSAALLRSLAIDVSWQSSGLGKMLVYHAEDVARSAGVESVYLLTTTAESFFEHLRYSSVSCDCAPAKICATEQFSDLCPVDSAFMMKCLGKSKTEQS